jgi:hypothetical protein
VSGVNVSVSSNYPSTDEVVRALRAAMQGETPHQAATAATAPAAIAAVAAEAQAQALPEIPVAVVKSAKATKSSGSKRYTLAFLMATAIGVGAIWFGNRSYGPEMYGSTGMVPAAEAHAKNLNYAVFDLNLNIRALRDEQLKRMTKTPDVILLGASHWQEAHKDLIRGEDFFNAHIHRDYWEDPLGMVELLVRNNRLPKKLIISIRDNQFTPVEIRKDFLWEPGIPAYRAMSERLGLETESYIKTLPYDRGRALMSLPMFFENFTRWHNAPEHPAATDKKHFETLDALLPDGSITWSNQHMKVFTQERTYSEAVAFAERRKNTPPVVEPKGVEAFEALLNYLKDRGVSVYLVKPPFNPTYYDRLQGTPYFEGLTRIEKLIQRIADDHKLPVFGSFNPHDIGCTSDMYIDAEHSNPKCLQKIFDQYMALDKKAGTN